MAKMAIYGHMAIVPCATNSGKWGKLFLADILLHMHVSLETLTEWIITTLPTYV